MRTIEVDAVRADLARLVDEAAAGTPFVITRGGHPLVRVLPVAAEAGLRRTGFLAGAISVPEDFDTMGADEVAAMFEGRRE